MSGEEKVKEIRWGRGEEVIITWIIILACLYYLHGLFESEDPLCSDLQQWKERKNTSSKVNLDKTFFKDIKGFFQTLGQALSIAAFIVNWLIIKHYVKKCWSFGCNRVHRFFTGSICRLYTASIFSVI